MRRKPTHYLIVNADGTSHLEPMTNTPNTGDCSCGRCGPERKPSSGRRATTNDLAAIRRGYLARAERETGPDRAASLGIAEDLAEIVDKRADGPFAWVRPIVAVEKALEE